MNEPHLPLPFDKRFAALRAAHADRVYRFALRLSNGCAADAEDLTQETLLAAFQSLPRFAGRSTVSTWLYRIAIYKWREMRQRRGEDIDAVSLGDSDAQAIAAQSDTAREATARLSLGSALAALPPALREAFLLVKAEGLTHREAAQVLEVPMGTMQSRVHDAVHRLRVLLADFEEG